MSSSLLYVQELFISYFLYEHAVGFNRRHQHIIGLRKAKTSGRRGYRRWSRIWEEWGNRRERKEVSEERLFKRPRLTMGHTVSWGRKEKNNSITDFYNSGKISWRLRLLLKWELKCIKRRGCLGKLENTDNYLADKRGRSGGQGTPRRSSLTLCSTPTQYLLFSSCTQLLISSFFPFF